MTRARIEIPIDLDDLPDRVVAIETSLAALHGKVDTLMGIAQDIRAAAQALKDGQAEAAA
jgi:hypothetical protein